MQIKEFIIHRIDKKQHADPKVYLRDKSLKATDPRVLKFTEIAVEVFRSNQDKPNSVFADFNSDVANYPFSDWCLSYFKGGIGFVKLTKDSTNRLAQCMKSQQLSTGGFVVFALIEVDGVSSLLVMMLHPQDGLSITEKLEFEDVTHLELRHIDKAALVTAPENGTFGNKPVTYAGFRKAMSQYFQEFIGPDAFRNPAKDSADLIDKLEDYAKANSFDEAKLDNARVAIRQYAQQCSADNTELDLSTVSALVNPSEPGDFAGFAAAQGVSAFIKPDPRVFKRWKTIKYTSTDGLIIQFKAELVGSAGTNHRLELDKIHRTLTIKDIEDDLIAKIEEAKA